MSSQDPLLNVQTGSPATPGMPAEILEDHHTILCLFKKLFTEDTLDIDLINRGCFPAVKLIYVPDNWKKEDEPEGWNGPTEDMNDYIITKLDDAPPELRDAVFSTLSPAERSLLELAIQGTRQPAPLESVAAATPGTSAPQAMTSNAAGKQKETVADLSRPSSAINHSNQPSNDETPGPVDEEPGFHSIVKTLVAYATQVSLDHGGRDFSTPLAMLFAAGTDSMILRTHMRFVCTTEATEIELQSFGELLEETHERMKYDGQRDAEGLAWALEPVKLSADEQEKMAVQLAKVKEVIRRLSCVSNGAQMSVHHEDTDRSQDHGDGSKKGDASGLAVFPPYEAAASMNHTTTQTATAPAPMKDAATQTHEPAGPQTSSAATQTSNDKAFADMLAADMSGLDPDFDAIFGLSDEDFGISSPTPDFDALFSAEPLPTIPRTPAYETIIPAYETSTPPPPRARAASSSSSSSSTTETIMTPTSENDTVLGDFEDDEGVRLNGEGYLVNGGGIIDWD
ncbi:MAG: hypothetical protein Q9169_004265 [Polycauliona sp. 2 TL-2023]